MKKAVFFFLLLVLFSSCRSLKSTTYIRPYDSFVLGNNEHGSFKVQLKNTAPYPLEVYLAPVGGGKHSSQMVGVGQFVSVSVQSNTAIVIANAGADTAAVQLKVTGDVGLSMGYKQ